MNATKNDMKIKRTFMKDEAYNQLRKWIITGRLKAGTKLRDQDLSDELGISRTPIREALLRLENDGLVVTKANRWTLVSDVDVKEAEDIYTIVWTLEALALEQAFPHFTSKDIEELEKYNENLKETVKSGDQSAMLHADNAFHNKILNLSKNEELPKLLYNLKLRIQRIEMYYFNELDRNTSYDEHHQLIQLIKKNDLSKAKEAIKANWRNSLDRIQQITE